MIDAGNVLVPRLEPGPAPFSSIDLLWRWNSLDSKAPTTASNFCGLVGAGQSSGATARAPASSSLKSTFIEVCISGTMSNKPEIE